MGNVRPVRADASGWMNGWSRQSFMTFLNIFSLAAVKTIFYTVHLGAHSVIFLKHSFKHLSKEYKNTNYSFVQTQP